MTTIGWSVCVSLDDGIYYHGAISKYRASGLNHRDGTLHAFMKFFERNVPEEEMGFVVEDWMQQVRQTMQPLINVGPDEIVNRHRRP
jgi:hypothetical protein